MIYRYLLSHIISRMRSCLRFSAFMLAGALGNGLGIVANFLPLS